MPTKIDENYQGVGLCVQTDDGETVIPIYVDPVTKRVLVDIITETSADLSPDSKIDQNYEGVSLAVTDDASADIVPLKVHPTSKGLLVDVLIE